MSFSANELQSLAEKAARGAGAHPAQAAHFGRAVLYHLAAGRSELVLTDSLYALPGGPIQFLPFGQNAMPDLLRLSYAEACLHPNLRPPLTARLNCSADFRQVLLGLAQNTYVPSSDASRALGAGAGADGED